VRGGNKGQEATLKSVTAGGFPGQYISNTWDVIASGMSSMRSTGRVILASAGSKSEGAYHPKVLVTAASSWKLSYLYM
jgi:hypothetical protein